MNSSAKIFFFLLFLILVATGIFFSDFKVLEIFSEKENLSFKKKISSKPKDMNKKQESVKTGINDQDEFTFFDILSDPSMEKFIGLDGITADHQTSIPRKPIDFGLKTDKGIGSQFKDSTTKNVLRPDPKILNTQTQGDSLLSGFVLQVGSFEKSQRAIVLKNKLIGGGYPAFIISTRIAENEKVLHRVFVGRFSKKIEAEKTAIKINETEKVDSLIKWQEGEPLKDFP